MALAHAIDELEAEPAIKLWLLAIAGAEARDIAAVSASTPWNAGESAPARQALHDWGDALCDNLLRGEAIACATGFDLDLPVAKWGDPLEHDLEARAWLSFGKQLASSQPGDWQCVSVVEPRARQQLTGVYLRKADHQWWSFRRQLDRPSPGSVDRERKRGRSAGVADDSLASLATHSCVAGGQALSRALRAIRARLGVAGEASASGSRRKHA